MLYSFDLLNKIFDICVQDNELCNLLKIDSTLSDNELLDNQNNKLRREYQTPEAVMQSDIPFISYYFMHSDKTKTNYLANIGDLYIDIYTNTMYDAGKIAKRFRRLMSDEIDMLMVYEGQHYSAVQGIYKYRLIYNPLIDGE